MSRTVEEWQGKDDDTAIPARVKLRVFDLFGGRCNECRTRIAGSIRPAFDHVIALVNGGQNREGNLQLLCVPCHREKTGSDVAHKKVAYRKRCKAIGLKKKRTITSWRRFDGTIVTASRER